MKNVIIRLIFALEGPPHNLSSVFPVRGKTIACDPHPCKDNPYKMCQPCGSHGTCVNLGTVNNTGKAKLVPHVLF